MENFKMALSYDKKIVVAHYINELIRCFGINIKTEDKEILIAETENVVELIAKANAAEAKRLKQETKESLEEGLATKEFVSAKIAEVRQEMAEMKAELKQEIANNKVDLIKWLVGTQIATASLIVALLKFL